MLAKALEHNGATVYIVGRRLDVLETAAHEESVSAPSPGLQERLQLLRAHNWSD